MGDYRVGTVHLASAHLAARVEYRVVGESWPQLLPIAGFDRGAQGFGQVL
jgi:hypothetical protein